MNQNTDPLCYNTAANTFGFTAVVAVSTCTAMIGVAFMAKCLFD